MPTKADMRWFKEQFGEKMKADLEGTPFSIDFMTALACQETGEVWPILRKKDLSLDRIVELCVGDTIDFNPTTGKGRKAFPRNKAALVAVPNGQKMFDVARQALLDMAQFIPGYQGAASLPNKFCHGFGIFQFDLQFFESGHPESDPDYFLERKYTDFNACLGKALQELSSAANKIGLQNKPALTDLEMVHVAIAYNTGGFNPANGLKQGFAPKDKHGNIIGPFYGEQVFDFLKTAKTVSVDGGGSTGGGSIPTTSGTVLKVTSNDPLRLRSEPVRDESNPNSNVKAKLPNGQIVRAVTNQQVNSFLEIETDFEGQHLRGFASAQFLQPV
jgi:hypothetical protein